MAKFEKDTKHQLCVFLKKTMVKSAKCEMTAGAHDAFCPLTQARRLSHPFNFPMTPSNYKHDAYTDLLVLKSGW